MAETGVHDRSSGTELFAADPDLSYSVGAMARALLMPLASLKLTVALFAMAIFIVFTGTLAQVEKDIWEAISTYFRTPVAWIDFQIFFPPSFFPSKPKVP